MANAANITQNNQINPSIFEVTASDSLNAAFYPAIERLVNLIATKNPEKFGWMVKYYDEFYLFLNGIIQNYYLKCHSGSIAEVFYSLGRYSTKTGEFKRREHIISLICIVFLPYLKSKLERLLKKWKEEEFDSNGASNKNKSHIIKTYTIFIGTYESLKAIQFVAYLANKTTSHTPLLRALNLSLKYLPPDETPEWNWKDLFSGKLKITFLLSGFLFRALELSAFFLQFVQWWQNETSYGDIRNLPIPPPPELDVEAERYKGLCPVCIQTFSIPTAVSISGYVFCYKCIIKHLENSKTCPVTNYPIDIDDLIRIYDD